MWMVDWDPHRCVLILAFPLVSLDDCDDVNFDQPPGSGALSQDFWTPQYQQQIMSQIPSQPMTHGQ
jgi:hypothetical protein